jgi:hypothetical protein
VCVIEMSGTSWLVAATVPGIDRRPLQKLPVNPARLLEQVERWRKEAARADRTITRTVVAYESGRDGGIVLLLRAGDQVLLVSFFTPASRLAAALTRSAFSPGSACAAP